MPYFSELTPSALEAIDLISRNALASGSCRKNTATQPGASALRLMVRLNHQLAGAEFNRLRGLMPSETDFFDENLLFRR